MSIQEPTADSRESSTQNYSPGAVSMWDAFEHIIYFITLCIVVSAISLILHAIVDKWVPGLSVSMYSTRNGDFGGYLVRGAVASLIVVYPFFAFLFLKITRRTNDNPDLRNLKSRKILIYFTLVVTFLIGIWSVIRGIYSFISGELSLNFVLNLLISLTTSGSVFFYYLAQVKEDRRPHG